MEISIVSPVYKAEEIIDELVKRIIESVSSITNDFEIIFIEDCSPDNSWQKIQENCKKDKRIKGIKLTRNFGQHYAITAGLEASTGNYVVVMDCDLQDDPKYIPNLYKKIREGFDIVYTRITRRSHSILRNFYSKLFSIFFNWLSDNNFSQDNVSAFSMLSRKVVEAYCKVSDSQRHYLMILRWLGFKHTYIDVTHKKRYFGKSSYTFFKLCHHAINGIISQSDKLLRISIALGLGFSFLSMTLIAWLIAMYFINGFKEGWTSVVVLILFSTGLVLISVGILGIYLGKTFEQVKNRPLYLIDEKINM